MNQLFAKKSLQVLLDEMEGGNRLRRILGPVQLTSLGVGCIIGTGIFVTTGAVAHDMTGPAMMLSFVVAGVACVFAALCYAELASMVPVAGSAYTYAYATLGELLAWIIGWDLVLEYGWAHGEGGNALKDKTAFNVVTTGGSRESYGPDGFNRFTLHEFLRPFEQTASLCKMIYLPPFAVQGTYRLSDGEMLRHAGDYAFLLQLLSDSPLRKEEVTQFDLLNDWLANLQRKGET